MSHLENLRKLPEKQQRTDYLNSLHFPLKVWKKNDFHYARYEDFGELYRHEDLKSLIENCEQKKQEYLDLLVEGELEELIQYPYLFEWKDEDKKKLLFFSIKVLIFSSIFSLCLGLSLNGVVKSFTVQVDKLEQKIEKTFNPSVEKNKQREERFRDKAKQFKSYWDILKEEWNL